MTEANTDIIIVGGGLAGLSLAKQLRQELPDLAITIIERNTFPVPRTTAKVGESTVEISSHYFTQILGMQKHFDENHLQKHGLRCFFGEPQSDYVQQDELGASQLFGMKTYQVERGVMENYLHDELVAQGVTIIDGASTDDIQLGNKKQAITVKTKAGEKRLESRWLIDAAGRQELVKKKLGLKKLNDHKGNAVYFRINKRITIDDWSDDPVWNDRVKYTGKRWLSTNHLMGAGYWLWLIPLGSGACSIGMVMDNQAFEESKIKTFEDTVAWLEKNQPYCAKAIEGAELLDFNVVQDYSYGCKKMFSDEGWGLTGEAGVFTDPFYSPGSDFISINNTFITHLVKRDMAGHDIRLDSAVFHVFYNSFFENTLSLYTHQYGGFGDRRMMAVKLLWDYAYYWGVLSLLFFKNIIADIDLMRSLNPLLLQAQDLNKQVQDSLIVRAKKRIVLPAKGLFIDQYPVPCLAHFTDVLKSEEAMDPAQTLEKNVMIMKKMAVYLTDMLSDNASTEISPEEKEILGEYRHSVLA